MGTVNTLRDVTTALKTFPFYYTALLVICWSVELFAEFEWILIIDKYVFLSFLVVAFLIRLSYPLNFCKWYRLQCVLPLTHQVVEAVDTYIYEFSANQAFLIGEVAAFIVSISTLVNIYFVIIKPKIRNA